MSNTITSVATDQRDTLPFSERVRHGNVLAKACPSRKRLQHLTSRWGVLVLVVLFDGTQRFSQLRRMIEGISERMLAQTLQQLEADGIVSRRVFQTVPPQVDYTLTPLGQEAALKVMGLVDWIEINLPFLENPTEANQST
ncbi:winged helix-turn-helix transcriptional regulator [Pseudomonas aeruginosa]|uniref:winged helix-turn-helix transcriptional regulator n=1 Tax=Pseudomonas aeruginosa TaxID=287 RepID=UPI000F51C10C|nr:helix-turn-helix domain-containing protein [Pseudomonas aeruginosa]RQB77662.1 transcriptional regulator [Pseudomonas aeruginosa]